jgi:hypothetical protein
MDRIIASGNIASGERIPTTGTISRTGINWQPIAAMPDDRNQDRTMCATRLLGEGMKYFIDRLFDIALYFSLAVFVANLIRGVV